VNNKARFVIELLAWIAFVPFAGLALTRGLYLALVAFSELLGLSVERGAWKRFDRPVARATSVSP
jgi:hypothetical protein